MDNTYSLFEYENNRLYDLVYELVDEEIKNSKLFFPSEFPVYNCIHDKPEESER